MFVDCTDYDCFSNRIRLMSGSSTLMSAAPSVIKMSKLVFFTKLSKSFRQMSCFFGAFTSLRIISEVFRCPTLESLKYESEFENKAREGACGLYF